MARNVTDSPLFGRVIFALFEFLGSTSVRYRARRQPFMALVGEGATRESAVD
jgi:hypothetical protein